MGPILQLRQYEEEFSASRDKKKLIILGWDDHNENEEKQTIQEIFLK